MTQRTVEWTETADPKERVRVARALLSAAAALWADLRDTAPGVDKDAYCLGFALAAWSGFDPGKVQAAYVSAMQDCNYDVREGVYGHNNDNHTPKGKDAPGLDSPGDFVSHEH